MCAGALVELFAVVVAAPLLATPPSAPAATQPAAAATATRRFPYLTLNLRDRGCLVTVGGAREAGVWVREELCPDSGQTWSVLFTSPRQPFAPPRDSASSLKR